MPVAARCLTPTRPREYHPAMPASLLLSSLLLLAPAPAPSPLADGAPAAFHVGTYSSILGARFTSDGFVDTGAVVGRFVDLDTGEPLALTKVRYEGGPRLELEWLHNGGGWVAEGEVGAIGHRAGEDERLLTGLRVLLKNKGDDPVTVNLGLDLWAGPAAGALRPEPSLAFDSSEDWLQEENLISRDGRMVARWTGSNPKVEVTPPGSVGDRAARLSWKVLLPPRNARLIETILVGAPVGAVDEAAMRRSMKARSYRDLEDVTRWESDAVGAFSNLRAADERFRDAFVAAVAQIRTFGSAYRAVTSLSDQPYGRPATDAAVSAQMLGVLFEVGMEEIGFPFLVDQLSVASEVLDTLPPERQLMYLHGLVRAVRLMKDDVHAVGLASLIERFSAEVSDLGVLRVDPWLHPENVRADLAQILNRSGRGGAERLPGITFSKVVPGTVEATMADLARTIKERDGTESWRLCQELLDRTSRRGFGTLSADGEPEGLWSLGMATLLREMLLDDHSEDLHIFSGVDYGLLTRTSDLDVEYMPSRFGMIKVQQYHVGRAIIGGWVRIKTDLWPERMLMHFPPSGRLKSVKPTPQGGHVTLLDKDTVELVVLPDAIVGLRFSMKAKPLPEDS
jgi:hypothetical protein